MVAVELAVPRPSIRPPYPASGEARCTVDPGVLEANRKGFRSAIKLGVRVLADRINQKEQSTFKPMGATIGPDQGWLRLQSLLVGTPSLKGRMNDWFRRSNKEVEIWPQVLGLAAYLLGLSGQDVLRGLYGILGRDETCVLIGTALNQDVFEDRARNVQPMDMEALRTHQWQVEEVLLDRLAEEMEVSKIHRQRIVEELGLSSGFSKYQQGIVHLKPHAAFRLANWYGVLASELLGVQAIILDNDWLSGMDFLLSNTTSTSTQFQVPQPTIFPKPAIREAHARTRRVNFWSWAHGATDLRRWVEANFNTDSPQHAAIETHDGNRWVASLVPCKATPDRPAPQHITGVERWVRLTFGLTRKAMSSSNDKDGIPDLEPISFAKPLILKDPSELRPSTNNYLRRMLDTPVKWVMVRRGNRPALV